MRSRKRKLSLPLMLAWLMLGILLSMIAIQFRLSGSINIKQFYDIGIKYVVRYSEYTKSYDGCEYEPDGMYHVTKDVSEIPIVMHLQKNRHWNYLYVDLQNLSTDKMTWEITAYNTGGKLKNQTTVVLKEGMNEIVLGPKKSSQICIRIVNQKGISFRINSMQFQKNPSYYELTKVLCMLLICMIVYMFGTVLLYHVWFRYIRWERIYNLTDWLIRWYRNLTGLWKGTLWNCNEAEAVRVRRSCFFIMIIAMILTENYGLYNKKYYYYVYLVLNCILLFIVARVSITRKRRKIKWKNPLMLSWFIYVFFISVADIVVIGKQQMWTGIMMFLVFGILYYVMAGMEYPIIVIYDFMQALKYSYCMFAVFSLCCRPIGEMAEGRYIGITVSPYSFAMYLTMVIIVFLTEIDKGLLDRTVKKYILPNTIGLISALYFLWLTGSRNGIMATGVCMLLYGIRMCLLGIRVPCRKRIIYFVCIVGIFALPTIFLQDWAVHNLAEKLGTVVYYPNDDRMLNNIFICAEDDREHVLPEISVKMDLADTVYAAESQSLTTEKRILQNAPSIELLSSGRTTIYKEYIAHMNLFGHSKELRIWGEKMRAHNAILQIGYRYGVFSMIPYTIMLLYVLIFSKNYMMRNWNRVRNYAVLPFLLAISCEIMMMLDNVERNFRYVPWVVFYLLIGLLGQDENKKF